MKNEAELLLRPEYPAYRPGDELTASIGLRRRRPIAVRSGVVELLCSGHYRGAHSKHHSGEAWVTHFKSAKKFMDATQVRPEDRLNFDAQFTLPIDAPPTYAGSLIELEWKLKAKLDVPRRLDESAEARVTVVRPALEANIQLDTPRRGTACHVAFDLPNLWVRAGDSVEGTVLVNVLKDVEITGAQLELLRTEVVYTGSFIRQGQKREKILTLAGASKSMKGLMETLGFRIAIPESSQPFLAVGEARGYHELRAKIALKGHTDCVSSVPLFIYNG